MRLPQLFKIMGFLTFVAVIYIHLQMEIIELAYHGKSKEKRIHKLIEENGNVTYSILMAKSAKHLGIKMLAEDSNMQFADPQNVVSIITDDEAIIEKPKEVIKQKSKENPLLSLLSFGSSAEATTVTRDR